MVLQVWLQSNWNHSVWLFKLPPAPLALHVYKWYDLKKFKLMLVLSGLMCSYAQLCGHIALELGWKRSRSRIQFDIEDTNITNFKLTCKNHVRNSFIENWTHQINDIYTNPIVRTYALYKHSFEFEPYLKQISNARYRNALTKLRVSSHSLAIERGRHLGTAIQERLCTVCNVIEDEKHFLFECCTNEELRFIFNSRVSQLYPQYQYLDSDQKLVFLFKIENEQLITWVGKFVYNSFCLREEYHGKRG